MKRIFALALAICMALSMMVLTASAVPTYVPSCTEHRFHLYVYNVVPDDLVYFYAFDGTAYFGEGNSSIEDFDPGFSAGNTSDALGKWYYATDNTFSDGAKCPQCRGFVPQPKTGVMDTLPLWFGVMAVSACAYVLTSKKKVF